jgi:hypothetical protein
MKRKIATRFKKLLYPILVTVLLLSVSFGFYNKTFYYPLSVSMEMRCDTLCQVNVFYSENAEFQQSGQSQNLYSTVEKFQTLTFLIPPSNIRKIRIDPTSDSVQFSLRRIIFNRGPDSLAINGKKIPTRFNLIGLKPVDSLCTSEIAVFKSTGGDPYIILKEDIQESIGLVNVWKTRVIRTIFLIICFVIWVLLIRTGRQVMIRFNKTMKNWLDRVNYFFRSTDRKFIFWIIGLIFFKYFLISAQSMDFITNAVFDDAWYVKHAFSLANGQWLGNYSSFTLLHGISYPFFIAVSNFLGLSLPLAQYILLVLSAIVFIYAIAPLIKNRAWLIILFVVILFNPMNSGYPITRILREGIYTSLGVLVFGAFIGMLVHRNQSKGSLLRWSLLASGVLFFFWNTREEGIIAIPPLLWFSIWGIFIVLREKVTSRETNHFQEKISCQIRKSFLFMLPFILLGAGNTMIATINYFFYGKFIVNELTSGTFPKANTALTKIYDDENKLMVPVTNKMLQQAYEVSPSFRQVKPILDNKDNLFRKLGPSYPDEYEGGWFYFAFRSAADQAGMHQNLTKAQEYYQSIANEINRAFHDGRLKKKELVSLLSFTWDTRFTRPFLRKTKESLFFAISFNGYAPNPRYHKNNPEQISAFQNITLTYTTLSGNPEKNQTRANQLKFSILKHIALLTSRLSAIAFTISLFSLVVISLFLLFSNQKEINTGIIWVILSGLLMMIMARVALVAYLAVTQFNAISPHYLNFVYPFVLIFTFLSIFFFSNKLLILIREKAKKQ